MTYILHYANLTRSTKKTVLKEDKYEKTVTIKKKGNMKYF